jgi:5,5'-dehydrodivanillate O-demethylase
LTGNWITSHVMNQDFVAWLGQGAIADRTQEHLGPSDRGIITIRKRFLDDIEAISCGEDPKAIVRDPEVNRRIDLPIVGKEFFLKGQPAASYANAVNRSAHRTYIFQAGQPEEVSRAWETAMGFEREEPSGAVLDLLAGTRRS